MGPQIRNSFTNIKGQTFDSVKELSFKKGELFGNLGRYITESHHEVSDFAYDIYDSHFGVYIYQDYKESNLGYKIYKDFAEYNFNGYGDDKLIQKLQERQKYIYKTEFPTGVVTLDGKIIGQQIPFYPNCVTLLDYIKTNININPVDIYIKVLQLLQELFLNGIIYLDIHSRNFMIDLSSLDVKLIDFDSCYIQFDDTNLLKRQLCNYRKMVIFLNDILNTSSITGVFKEVDNFDSCFEQLNEMSKILKKN